MRLPRFRFRAAGAHGLTAPPLPPIGERCTATTRAGVRCKLEAGPDGLCPFHGPHGPRPAAA
jgi:hypothetical protein